MICKADALSQIAGDAVPEQVPVDVPSLRFDRQKRPPVKEEDWKGSAQKARSFTSVKIGTIQR